MARQSILFFFLKKIIESADSGKANLSIRTKKRGYRMTLALAVILIIVFWFVIDFHFGRNRHRMIKTTKQSPAVFGRIDIFPHGRELFRDYFQELRKAKFHIHVLFYILKDDAISNEFLAILKEKAMEGVEVRLMLDRIGSKSVKKAALAALRSAGVQFTYCNRLRFPFLFYSSQVRNHRKVSIIDGTIGYLGGFNVGREYIDLDLRLSPWRDYHLKMTGEGVSFLQRDFLSEWKEYFGVNLLGNAGYFPDAAQGIVQHQVLATEARQLEEYYLQLIGSAQTSILIGTPYFIPSDKIFAALLTALHRGVSLTVIVPSKSDHILVKEASYRYLRRLLTAGAKVFQFKNGFYHAKTVIIDQKICVVGTANFDKRSFFLNKEMICSIYDQTFMDRIAEVIKKDLLDSKPLQPADLNRPNSLRWVKEAIAGTISYFL